MTTHFTKRLLIVFFTPFSLIAAAQSVQDSFVQNGGLWYEVLDSMDKSPTRYSVDNTIYALGSIHTYAVRMQDKNQKDIACDFHYDENKDWSDAGHFIEPIQKNKESVEYISYRVPADPTKMEMSGGWAYYRQTDIWIDYKNAQKQTLGTQFDSMHWNPDYRGKFMPSGDLTGVIDNKKNVWIHPPRMRCFKINELNPFPFVQLPLMEGNKWSWGISAGGEWGDKRWAAWSGLMPIKSTYEVKEKTKRMTKMGELDCFRVECEAISSVGTTHLTFFFNPKFGFVHLEFTNIDKSKTTLELIEKK
jgi:hypothetical protein